MTYTIAESSGVYLIATGVGIPASYQAEFIVDLSGVKYSGITKSSTNNNNQDMITKNIITNLYAADTVHVTNSHPAFGEVYLQTSISIFSISDSMVTDMVAFSVAREHTFSGFINPVPFDVQLYNDGLHYDQFSHTFFAPSAGVYFFSFSVGLEAGGTANFVLYKNDEPFVTIVRQSVSHTGTDTMSRSIMMNLERDATVHVVNEAGQTARSSTLRETSLCGFKYEPRHGSPVSEALLVKFGLYEFYRNKIC